jgi:LuxR family maltose regulon positive regulatory protein
MPSQLVMALTALADAELASGDRAGAHAALGEAREVADADPMWPFVLRGLEEAEVRMGRGAARAARRMGVLSEELTDRELSILRMLPGSVNQREIGAALFLSINTVKGYTKSLYRKLDVGTRQDAVARGRELGLI